MSAPGLLGARRLRDLLERHGVRPDKALGQNFVVDPNTIRKVLAVARLSPSDRVLEIGAGIGSLTLALAQTAQRVIAVEFDRRLLPLLAESLAEFDNVDVIHADALEVDLASIDACRLVANLPYNIAATVVLRVLEDAPAIRSLTVMTQKEVGERLSAAPGSKSYGATSVLVAYFASASIAGKVSRRAFYPVPGVDSVIVRIERDRPAPDVDRHRFYEVVRSAFSQRRKTLRNTLAPVMAGAQATEQALRRLGIDPSARAEELSCEQFVAIARVSR